MKLTDLSYRLHQPGLIQINWAPYTWLIYIGFLFVPAVSGEPGHRWLWPTLLSLPVFGFLYVRIQRMRWHSGDVWEVLGIAALCYALTPLNAYGNTYLIYAAAFLPLTMPGLRGPLLATVALLALYAVELFLLRTPWVVLAITVIVSVASCAGNYLVAQYRLRTAELKLSHAEIRQLAAAAERERIGRDLHDLLGHTLSLIAIKSELAGKLIDRNTELASREIADVTSIARETLKQVRTAVTGIRSVALGAELVSSRVLLECSGVTVTTHHDGMALPSEIETALAMVIREGTTNIHRHAGATRARVEVRLEKGKGGDDGSDMLLLLIEDDGRGGVTTQGNGLAGIGERIHSLGGKLEIESAHGRGTVLRARLPVGLFVSRASAAAAIAAADQVEMAST